MRIDGPRRGASVGKNRAKPNKFIAIVWIGAASLASGVITLGIGLLTASPSPVRSAS